MSQHFKQLRNMNESSSAAILDDLDIEDPQDDQQPELTGKYSDINYKNADAAFPSMSIYSKRNGKAPGEQNRSVSGSKHKKKSWAGGYSNSKGKQRSRYQGAQGVAA